MLEQTVRSASTALMTWLKFFAARDDMTARNRELRPGVEICLKIRTIHAKHFNSSTSQHLPRFPAPVSARRTDLIRTSLDVFSTD
jgi:hypothetical protein